MNRPILRTPRGFRIIAIRMAHEKWKCGHCSKGELGVDPQPHDECPECGCEVVESAGER